MKKRYEMIVFDWDGTLMDSAGSIVQSLQSACRDLDIPPPSDKAARQIIGLGLIDAVRQAVPGLDPEYYPRLAERYRTHFMASDHQLSLFPGARELILELEEAGFILAVATGKSRMGLERVLKSSGIGPHFHATRTVDECFSKPHPQMLMQLMEEFAVSPEQTLMIGDTTHDLKMAANAGTPALAVSFGAHDFSELESCAPLACFDDYMTLTAWLRENAGPPTN